MSNYKVSFGGGWQAIRYSRRMARKVGGVVNMTRALRSKNTCKACALGMGGLDGGMVNEAGQHLEVCKKSMQAQAQDMQPGIPRGFFNNTPVAELKKLSGRELEALGRLVDPLYLPDGASHFEILTWERALALLAARWKNADTERSFFYASGRSSMEAAFLLQLLVRQWGSNNINNCSYYCHQASGVGLSKSLGGGTSTVTLEDVMKSDLVVLIGANPSSNHPRFMKLLMELRRRGGSVVVVNPIKEIGLRNFRVPSDPRSMLFGSEIANLYLQPHCGGDLAFLKAAATQIWRDQKADLAFMENNCNDFNSFKSDLESSDLQALSEMSGISCQSISDFCNILSESENTIFAWAMGITHQEHGVRGVQAIANLAFLRGMVGKPGAGLLPLRGHSNVQGVGSVGVAPKLKPAMAKSMLEKLGVAAPTAAGMDTFACMQAAGRGEIDFAVMLGGNLYGSNPASGQARQALANIDFTTMLNTTMNLGHLHGHGRNNLILPVRARDEEKQSTSQESMFNFVRLSVGGEEAPTADLPAESEIIAHIGEQLLHTDPIPWHELRRHRKVREFIAATVPGLEPLTGLDSKRQFTIPGRILHEPKFKTENGKANLAVLPAFDARPGDGNFNLTTIRSEGQFNTIIYEDEDIYRGAAHRQVVFVNQNDLTNLGCEAGDWVWVESDAGKMRVQAIVAEIRDGNVAMYFPEANAIVPARTDPDSLTPVFKRIKVRIGPDIQIESESKNLNAAMAGP